MKILQTADWHLGTFKSPVRDGVNLRTEDTKRCLDEMVRVATKERPDYTLVSGDVFHVGHLWSDRCCEEIVTAVHYIKALALVSNQVVVMRGTPNHDGIGQFNVLAEMFSGFPSVHIVTTPQALSFDDVDIAILPGFDKGIFRAKNPGNSKEEENEIFTKELTNIVLGLRSQCLEGKKSVLMAHYTVPGCNSESGQMMMLTKFEPVLTQEALLAADFDLVALGHIHRPQRVTENNWYYSGAVNAYNFNDEGQERGFYIHTSSPWGGWESEFYKLPIREFITFEFSDTDVTAIIQGNMDEVAMNYWRWNGAVSDKIVRIIYSCSPEKCKAFKTSEAVLERCLLDDGAFMVWEIRKDSDMSEDAVNRTELEGTTDPETNLVKYLEEKQMTEERIQQLVAKARPVIARAQAEMPTGANTGVFEPVEIEVMNYRNYVEERFNFEDISFCTINGQNGSGKSSLFMDAIIDCLYEEPRENELTGWVRNDENGCKGVIMFTFRIGEKVYRVTRTRNRPKKDAKDRKGKGTLNLAELVGDEWEDRSKERYDDTQQEIINIIGMDSLSFRSCALIMQDQYGVFLQAKPEERIEVLGNLLGLDIYQEMEKISVMEARAFTAKLNELKSKIEIHEKTVSELGDPEHELKVCISELKASESQLKEKMAERERHKLLLVSLQEAAGRHEKLLAAITELRAKRDATGQNRASQQAIIDSCSIILDSRQEIEGRVAEYNALMERERNLATESALYFAKKREAEGFASQAASEQEAIDSFKARLKQKEDELSRAQPADQDAAIKENAAEYERQKILLDEAYEQERAYREVEKKLTQAKYDLQRLSTQHDSDVKRLQLGEDELKKKSELLSNVECVDISQAKCGFLADAISAKQDLEDYPGHYAELEKAYGEQVTPINQRIAELEGQLTGMSFEAGKVVAISKRIAELKPYVAKLEAINQREGEIALLKVDIQHLQSNILGAEKRFADAKLKATEAERERDRYAEVSEEHGLVMGAITKLEPWLEKERQLPVSEERKSTAMGRVLELTAEFDAINKEIVEKQDEADKELQTMNEMADAAGVVDRMNAEVDAANAIVKEKQMELGALRQKADQISKLKEELSVLYKKQADNAEEAADYDALKAAFSQSGIPHQIIRTIIPQMEMISNSILEQMTGGKMGVGFQMESLQKNGKEKVTLDIDIEEYGKPALPYLSRSGGEKVRSSLSVILALAEIKASSAGLQLGMLFIDEPPFLDGDGIQAYCDALETIQRRYGNIKIMAITHDPTMKARFPQNLDVVRTENGSKVIY